MFIELRALSPKKKKKIVGNHEVRSTVQPSSKQFILL